MTQEERWILEKYNGEKTVGFFADLARLEAGEPLAFILGSIPFLNTTIYLDSRPLIPRVETEFWVAEALRKIAQLNYENVRILDLCAGSGAIGVAAAKTFSNATVHFAEIDTKHHVTIRKNIKENNILTTTAVFDGDLFEHTEHNYDVILCNPPYIRNGSEHVEESVKKYEPALALYGGTNGTDLIAQIIAEAPSHLSAQGILFIEHEPEQASLIASCAQEHGFTCTAQTDQYNIVRYSELCRTRAS